MQLSTKWEIMTRTIRYVLGSRNDDLLTIGGRVLAVPSIEHHLVGFSKMAHFDIIIAFSKTLL